MPKNRGITVSIISQWEMKQFPEFPYPDGAQSKFRDLAQGADRSGVLRSTSTSNSTASSTSDNTADSGLDREAVVSCYIPSIPGLRFFLKYAIEPPYPKGQLFYFKLLMNGRHISSWGINPRINPKGQVVRGLFEPDVTWTDSHNGLGVLRQNGIESRPFLFTPIMGGKSAADDGGVIEIRAFRAKGRRRRAPSFEIFRPQEQYGLNLPSAGLLDKPQDTRYYEYLLVDPKDEPYATFLFNYRSWEFLQSLQLIPSSCPQKLLKPSSSFAFLSAPATVNGTEVDDEADVNDKNDHCDAQEESYHRVRHISQLHNPKAGTVAASHCIKTSGAKVQQSGARKSRAEIPISAFAVPHATLDDWAYDRPLPRLPKTNPSSVHSRNSSTSSNTPSITPSLMTWLDRDANNASPEPIIGVAIKVPVLRTPQMPEVSMLDHSSFHGAESPFENPSPQAQPIKSLSNSLFIPREAIFLPSSITIRKSSRRSSYLGPAQGRLLIEESDTEDNELEWEAEDKSAPPAEAEWPSRQPRGSPIRRNSKDMKFAAQKSLFNRDAIESPTSSEHAGGKNLASLGDKTPPQGYGQQENMRILQHSAHPDQMVYYGKSEWI